MNWINEVSCLLPLVYRLAGIFSWFFLLFVLLGTLLHLLSLVYAGTLSLVDLFPSRWLFLHRCVARLLSAPARRQSRSVVLPCRLRWPSHLVCFPLCVFSTTNADLAAAALSRSSTYTWRLGLSDGSDLLSCTLLLLGLTSCCCLMGDTMSLCCSRRFLLISRSLASSLIRRSSSSVVAGCRRSR